MVGSRQVSGEPFSPATAEKCMRLSVLTPGWNSAALAKFGISGLMTSYTSHRAHSCSMTIISRLPLRWTLGAAACLAAAVTVLPDLLLLDRFTPFAQVVAFRPVLTAAVALVVVTGFTVPSVRRRAAAALAALAVVPLVGAGLLLPRVVADGGSASGPEAPPCWP